VSVSVEAEPASIPRAPEMLVLLAERRVERIARILGRHALDMVLPDWVTATADAPDEDLRRVVPLPPPPEDALIEAEEAELLRRGRRTPDPRGMRRGIDHGPCGTDGWVAYWRPAREMRGWYCLECSRRRSAERRTGRPAGRPRRKA